MLDANTYSAKAIASVSLVAPWSQEIGSYDAIWKSQRPVGRDRSVIVEADMNLLGVRRCNNSYDQKYRFKY